MSEESTEQSSSKGNYSRTINTIGWFFAILTAFVSIAAFLIFINEPVPDGAESIGFAKRKTITDVLGGMLLLPFGGYIFGVSLAVLFASTKYLSSPDGEQWLDMVGTKSILEARVISFIFGLFGIALITFLILALVTDDFKKPLFGASQSEAAVSHFEISNPVVSRI